MSTLRSASIHALRIPFVESFSHRAAERSHSDSIVVRVVDENGIAGYGEGVPRTFVTGESAEFAIEHLATTLLPSVMGLELPTLTAAADLARVSTLITALAPASVRSDNSSRAALELALIDCALRGQGFAAADVLGARGRSVRYSGVIGGGSFESAATQARQMKLIGLRDVKVKVGYADDERRVGAIREILGDDVSIRLDANGAWTLPEAVSALTALAAFHIALVEEPLARSSVNELSRLRQTTDVPLMVDESLVTEADADALLTSGAIDFVNVRVSKCGGLGPSLALARRAAANGIGVLVGAHVGETAILSAAGRLVAAAAPDTAFVEGSFGSLLLVEDISTNPVRFGRAGVANVLGGGGLGVDIDEGRLRRYSSTVRSLIPAGGAR